MQYVHIPFILTLQKEYIKLTSMLILKEEIDQTQAQLEKRYLGSSSSFFG